jgi:hypothetical protein
MLEIYIKEDSVTNIFLTFQSFTFAVEQNPRPTTVSISRDAT